MTHRHNGMAPIRALGVVMATGISGGSAIAIVIIAIVRHWP